VKRQSVVTERLHYVSQAVLPEKLRRLFHSRRLRGPFLSNEGHCWTAHLPELHHVADSPETPQRSPLMVYENGVPFLEAHVPHQYIRTEGGGLFSHWQDFLFFSSSDNSDPNTNGRRYSYTVCREFYRPPTRVWNGSQPIDPSREVTGSFFKRWPRLWYRIEEMQIAYLHPRMSEEFFRLYLRERKEHPGHQSVCLARKISMLHEEVLMLLRLFVIGSRGAVLEIGSYIGGATIVLAGAAKEFRRGPGGL
jgi:hypothetical protein